MASSGGQVRESLVGLNLRLAGNGGNSGDGVPTSAHNLEIRSARLDDSGHFTDRPHPARVQPHFATRVHDRKLAGCQASGGVPQAPCETARLLRSAGRTTNAGEPVPGNSGPGCASVADPPGSRAATSRSNVACRALKTTPIPPEPRTSTSSRPGMLGQSSGRPTGTSARPRG
jgi:hypothetical protein